MVPAWNPGHHGIWPALLLIAIVTVLSIRSLSPPEPLPLNAPADQFSGLRAAAALADLLGDETPQPVGTAANHAVRDRLVNQLEAMGLTGRT